MTNHAMLEIAGLAARIILENGAETYRVEDTVLRLCRSYGYAGADVIALSTGVMISVDADGQSGSVVRRVRKRGMNLARVNAVNDLSRRIAQGNVPMEEALAALREIAGDKDLPALPAVALAGLSAGCFALMLGAGLVEFAVALVCGMAAHAIARGIRRAALSLVLASLLGGLACSGLAMAAHRVLGLTPWGVEAALSGAIMPLLSGLMMTNAVRDSLRGDLLSGLARGVEALLVAAMVALGIGLALGLYMPGEAMTLPAPPPWYTAVAFAGLGTLCFCPLIRVPVRAIAPASLLGAAAYGGFLLLRDGAGAQGSLPLFLAAAVTALFCEALARRMRMIATVFLCVALIPLVPGLSLYRTMRALLMGAYESALAQGAATLLAVGAIALGAAMGSLRLSGGAEEG